MPDAPLSVVGSDVNEDDAFGSHDTPEREPLAFGEETSVGEPPRLKRTMSANELLQKKPRLERCSGIKQKRMLGHTWAAASSHAEVPLTVFWF